MSNSYVDLFTTYYNQYKQEFSMNPLNSFASWIMSPIYGIFINANIDEVYTTEDIIVCDFRISSQQSIHFRIVILQAIQTKGLWIDVLLHLHS